MLMAMLEAGGLALVIDGIRTADEDNPKGYYELERVKALDKTGDTSWVAGAHRKGLKVISFLLSHLPDSSDYKIIFVRRSLPEVLASQKKMVPLRDRCSFGRFTWLISQALTVTYVVGEHRLYLERNCRLPESGPQETAESRGACQFQGAEQSAGFGPAVEPRRT